jgi:hypothetical protein
MLALPALWYGGLSMLLAVIAVKENVAPAPPLPGWLGKRLGQLAST